MLKPAGSLCNLRCKYCYYLEKSELYPDESTFFMTDDLLEEFTRQYIESQTTPEVLFTWHGGETLIRDIEFYKKALAFQRKHAGNRQIDNCLQTNGTLLSDEWCKFFSDNNFLIGISLDGSQHLHDKYRKTPNGSPSFDKVIKGVDLLKKHGVEFNIMGVVNDYNVDYPLEFYRFFKAIDCHYIQFAPVVERINEELAPWSVPSEKWGDFLISIFDEWVRKDVGKIFIQYFDSVLASWMNEPSGLCTLSKICGHAGVMEFNGDVYACDHFVFPQYKLGNIKTNTLTEMMYSSRQIQFGKDKYTKLPEQCNACEYLFACYGECPKNRILETETGEQGMNYLCKGYYKFFEHITPYMDFMCNELIHRQPPANIMNAVRQGHFNY